jgi:autotransporter-associated beta strand protein
MKRHLWRPTRPRAQDVVCIFVSAKIATKTRNALVRSLLSNTALVHTGIAVMLLANLGLATASAQDATWLQTPGSPDFNTATNWNTGAVPTGTAFFGTSNTTSLTFSAPNTTVGGWTFNPGASNYTFGITGQSLIFNGAGIIINGGGATINNNSTPTNVGIIMFEDSSTAGSATITNNGASVIHRQLSSIEFLDSSTAGNATITNNASVVFENTSTAGNATITNNLPISVIAFRNSSTAGDATITNNGMIRFVDSSTGGTARFINGANGVIDLSSLVSAGITAGSIEGAGNIFLGAQNLAVGGNNLSTTFSGVLQDGGISGGTGGSLTKTGTGTLTLTGANTYTGPTNVNGGALVVDGSIASSSLTSVNSGGTLGGTGTVGNLTVAGGGTFAPGPANAPGTIAVNGNLVFQAGAIYVVQVTPSTASSANVSGTATLAGGSVEALFAAGGYMSRQYTILHSGGLGGTTFSGLSGNLPPGFAESLSYTATDVLLDLTARLGFSAVGLSQNQRNVANAINGFFNAGGTLPPAFVNLFGLTGGNLANALSQLSGEPATGAQRSAFQLMSEFLDVMLDPFVDGRRGIIVGPALGFASEPEGTTDDAALAYARVTKAPGSASPPPFGPYWVPWGGAYGGYSRTDGDPSGIGSHDLSARTGGFTAGLDYHIAPYTVVGFALAGGGTNWGLAQGLGGGKSDAFQAGAYGATQWGPAYVAASLAFTNHWMSTDRFAAFADHLTASFDAQSFGARVETGYQLATPIGGVAPYAAVQAQGFHTPGYNEIDASGGSFALDFNARTATDTRSELGGRFDYIAVVSPSAILTLRGRLAWAHDWVSDPSLTAVFQELPGASFVVNGAMPAKDSALATAGAEVRLASGLSFLAKFDGEFAAHASTYAGTGIVRYTW